MSKIKQDTVQRNILINQITELNEFAKLALDDTSVRSVFKIRYKFLEEIYSQFQQLHLNIVSSTSEDKHAEQDKIRLQVDTYYYNILDVFQKLYPENEVKDIVELPKALPTQAESRCFKARLPELTLPKFSGDIKSYESYIDIFNSLIHGNALLNDIDKFQYLVLSLADEPLNLIKGIPLTASNYELAYTTLTERYCNRRLLASVHLGAIKNYPALRSESPTELRKLIDCFVENIAILKKLELPTDHWDFILVEYLLEKIDAGTRKRFELHSSSSSIPKFAELKDFLLKQCIALDSISANRELPVPVNKFSSRKENTRTSLVSNDSRKSYLCVLCKNSHFIFKCSSFLTKSPLDRYHVVKRNGLCLNCLKPNHSLSNCKSASSCNICRVRHHTLLHRDSQQTNSSLSPTTTASHSSGNNANENPHNSLTANRLPKTKPEVLLGTIVLDMCDSNGNFRPVRALLDSASQCSFISQRCLRRFGLKQTRVSTPVQGIGQASSQSNGHTNVTIRPKGKPSPGYSLDAVVLQPICANMPNFSIKISDTWSHLQNIKLADPLFMVSREIDLLIGAELYPYILREGNIRPNNTNLPVAINTVFGYVICGNLTADGVSSPAQTLCCTVSLDNSIRQFWELEKIPEKKFVSPDDEKCENIFLSETYRTDDGRFVVPLPLKDTESFGDSYQTAYRRLLSLERRLAQNPVIKESYLDFMRDYLEQGHMEIVPDGQPEPELVYYIPHQYVIKEDSKTTKLRVVFDASARTSLGIALNDKQFVGPKLQSDIAEILLRFRQHSVVFSADIKQMFRNILLQARFQDLQRILFRFAENEPVMKYRLKTVTYGLSSSPYLAIRTLHQLAVDEMEKYPAAAQVLLKDTFVDDILSGAPSLEQALTLQSELIDLLQAGGFALRKWVSNSSEVLNSIPADHQAISFDTNEPNYLKILGLQYSPENDSFFYQINITDVSCTKRQILSDIARIFDPLGFLSPVTLQAKRFIQLLWLNGLSWDDTPSEDIVNNWQRFKSELPHLSSLRIQRYIPLDSLRPDSVVQLHAFADASSHGLSAVVFFRVSQGDSVRTYLICGKTKVAPLKQSSIPRLELIAAHMLSILVNYVVGVYKSVLDIDSIYCWSDSTCALSWIKSSPHRWKPFVANRVSAIQELTLPSSWHYISSASNPADAPSRGQFPLEFLQNNLWFKGPDWLQLDEAEWPFVNLEANLDSSVVDAECRKSAIALVVNVEQENFIFDLLNRFSSLQKLIHIVSYVRRFIAYASKSTRPCFQPLSAREKRESLLVIVKAVQGVAFSDEIQNLKVGKSCSKPFRKLNAFLCPMGILRVGGRLSNSDLDFNEKHPAILPKAHRLTDLIVEDTHKRYLHPGFNTLKFLIQQNFWIVSPKKAINACISRCVKCFRTKPKIIQPLMSDLPSFRVSKQLKPFTSVGIDYGGPFTVKCAKHRSKVYLKSYLCLFVCMATKAVHLELVSDLTADAFIATLRRFVARRGTCVEIISDNGTNFVAANRLLNEYCKQAAEAQSITWKFNPPAAPHMGGLFEAGIKSVKSHLKRTIGTQILTFEELYTIVTQVEALLNSRPLGPISSDPNDLLPLTPGHFLTLQPLTAPPDPDVTKIQSNRLTRWQLVQRVVQDTWRRFKHEYLHSLQQRAKWHTQPADSILPGALVLIKDENLPPLKWSLGRVEIVHPGRDGIARVVTVRTPTGTYKRPVVKVCPLPID